MTFFIPHATDDKQAEEVWESIRKFAEETTGWNVKEKRIKSLTFLDGRKSCIATVGEELEQAREPVFAILESVTFLVCTPNRGVLRGNPVLIGRNDVIEIFYFEGYE